MRKLDRDRDFDAGTYKWRFELWLNESGDNGAKYEIRLYHWMLAAEAQRELFSVESLSIALAHAFVENNALYESFIAGKMMPVIDNASKL